MSTNHSPSTECIPESLNRSLSPLWNCESFPSRELTRLSAEGGRGEQGQRGAGPPHELVGASYERGDMLASPSSFRGLCEADFERFTQGGSADLEAQGGHGGISERGSMCKPPRISRLIIANLSRPSGKTRGINRIGYF